MIYKKARGRKSRETASLKGYNFCERRFLITCTDFTGNIIMRFGLFGNTPRRHRISSIRPDTGFDCLIPDTSTENSRISGRIPVSDQFEDITILISKFSNKCFCKFLRHFLDDNNVQSL
jgi:hypothetical protein